jgi:hypothetical protein
VTLRLLLTVALARLVYAAGKSVKHHRLATAFLVVGLGLAACGSSDRARIPLPGQPALAGSGGRAGGAGGGGGAPGVDAGVDMVDASAAAGMPVDAKGGAEGGVVGVGALPVLTGLTPASGTKGAAVTLKLEGTGFASDTVAFFDGQEVAVAQRTGTSSLTVMVPAALTGEAGFHAMTVAAGAAGSRSGVAYYAVAPPMGWPEVVDFNPDSGGPGAKILVVGLNLSGGPVQITDVAGHKASAGRIGTVVGNNALLETAELTLPADFQSGPLLVSNAAGTFRGKVFNLGKNLAQLPGTKVTASSEYGGDWTAARGADNDIFTSWFTAAGDCVSNGAATCKTAPWFLITFPSPQTVARLALRGNREYTSGYDFLRARFELLGEGEAVLWSASLALLEPDRDLDLTLPSAVAGVKAVRFRSEVDESEDPGFGELEVFGAP